MNFIDVILILIIAFFLIKGLFRGLIMEVFTLAGFVVAYIVATKEMDFAAAGISGLIELPPAVLTALSFFLIFIFIVIAARLIAGAIHRLIKKTPVAWLNYGAGGLIGLFKGAMIASLMVLLLSILPLSGTAAEYRNNTFLYNPLLVVAPAVFNLAQRHFPEAKSFVDEMRDVVETQSESVKRSLFQKQLDSLEKQLQKTGKPSDKDLEELLERYQ